MTYWEAVVSNTKWLARLLAMLVLVVTLAAIVSGIIVALGVYVSTYLAIFVGLAMIVCLFAWIDWRTTNKMIGGEKK